MLPLPCSVVKQHPRRLGHGYDMLGHAYHGYKGDAPMHELSVLSLGGLGSDYGYGHNDHGVLWRFM